MRESHRLCRGIDGIAVSPAAHGLPAELRPTCSVGASNATLTTRLVDTVSTPMRIKAVQSGNVQPGKLVTHRFALVDILKAYDTFGNAAKHSALKVVLKVG